MNSDKAAALISKIKDEEYRPSSEELAELETFLATIDERKQALEAEISRKVKMLELIDLAESGEIDFYDMIFEASNDADLKNDPLVLEHLEEAKRIHKQRSRIRVDIDREIADRLDALGFKTRKEAIKHLLEK